jgi:hypothetical protein
MSIVTSIAKADVTVTAVFRNDSNEPTDPDGPVRWSVYRHLSRIARSVVATATQQLVEAVSTGTFRFTYAPPEDGTYSIEAAQKVGGKWQPGRIQLEVTWVSP